MLSLHVETLNLDGGGSVAMSREEATLPLFVHCDKPSRPDHTHLDTWSSSYWNRYFRGVALLALAFFLSAGYFRYGHWYHFPSPQLGIVVTTGIGLPKEVQQAWAAHSPYFAAAEYKVPPENCEITQVNLLQRHGARFPTASSSRKMKIPLQKLMDATSYSDKAYEFLSNFEWDLGEAALIPLGAKEAFDSGSEHYVRYNHLIASDQLPFVRASGGERVIYSAANWTRGFSSASGQVYSPNISVIISEAEGANNTLEDSMCPNAHSIKEQGYAWRDRFTPVIVDRIKKAVPGADLDNGDVVELMPLCAFETLFHGTASPFCGLFTAEEWQAREYYDDILKYYKTGHGNPLGPVQGVGYVNELLARLSGKPVEDRTQTNRTLDSSPVTFPLDRNFYADFSHDNEMVAIYSAIGLFRQDEPPSPRRLDPTRPWRISKMTPFSGRMITEKLRCNDNGEHGEYVRILVNDAVQPLAFCGASEEGLCEMSAFVESQAYARSNGNGDWDKCFA
ncbi:phosphoglycerate mutase-like protein [Gyrodon lividus]|nr:phosphoglycerate mutase-like protein [Gyrodon lividus]